MAHLPRRLTGDVAFAAALRDTRRAAGMTQAELAAAASVPVGLVAKAEQGERRVTVGEAAALATALGTSLDAMLAEPAGQLVKAPPGRPPRAG